MAETVQKHPEAKPGEVFLKNCNRDEPDIYADIPYKTKRTGKNAYDRDYNVIPNCFPVFVWEMEHDRRTTKVKIGA